jgi:hypothetical protein
MRRRCCDPENKSFKYYGGRGIKVCERWGNYACFKEDMGGDWREGLTLDRIDNNGPYNKENCRWATWKTQFMNKRQAISSNGRFKATALAVVASH